MSEVAQVTHSSPDGHIPQLRFPEFVGEWETNNLLSLSKVKMSNGVFNDPKKVGSGYRLINVKDMYVEGKIDVNTLTLLELEKNEFEKNKAIWGDVFFTRSSLVREGIAFSNAYLDEFQDVTYDGHLVRMRPNQDKIETLFLSYSLKTSSSRKQFIVRGKTTTMTTIGQEDISTVVISYPTKPEQQKIAAFLTAVDNKIEQLSKKQALLGEYKKGLTQQIFSQAIRFKADDGSDFPDWKEKKLENVLKRTSTGLNPRQNFKLGYGENYYVTIKNISNGKLDFSKCERIDENAMTMIANRSDLSKGDLIMSSIGNVGESYLLDKEPENWNINESVFMLRASELMLPQFLYFIITNEQSKWYLESNSTGSSFKSIKLGELKLLPLGLPSLEEQTKIANFLSSIDTKIEQVGKQLDESKQFKKALLQQMFV